MTNPLDEKEIIGRIEGDDISDFDNDPTDELYRNRLILEAAKTPFWNEVLIPDLNNAIAVLDSSMTTEADPWRRYGIVEAYKWLTEFKLLYLDVLENAQAT